ncbi:hypothetical protein P7H19_10510 [Paenibacillus larvae]|nr:hypothetical protein [Paenibacillus larvae]MDT2236637.1 hypothetical protein [Paenibacillus larvae]
MLHPKQQMNPRDNTSEFVAWEPMEDDRQHQYARLRRPQRGKLFVDETGTECAQTWLSVTISKINGIRTQSNYGKNCLTWFTKVVVLGDPAGKKTKRLSIWVPSCTGRSLNQGYEAY